MHKDLTIQQIQDLQQKLQIELQAELRKDLCVLEWMLDEFINNWEKPDKDDVRNMHLSFDNIKWYVNNMIYTSK